MNWLFLLGPVVRNWQFKLFCEIWQIRVMSCFKNILLVNCKIFISKCKKKCENKVLVDHLCTGTYVCDFVNFNSVGVDLKTHRRHLFIKILYNVC
jgi:hypothetical protein